MSTNSNSNPNTNTNPNSDAKLTAQSDDTETTAPKPFQQGKGAVFLCSAQMGFCWLSLLPVGASGVLIICQ